MLPGVPFTEFPIHSLFLSLLLPPSLCSCLFPATFLSSSTFCLQLLVSRNRAYQSSQHYLSYLMVHPKASFPPIMPASLSAGLLDPSLVCIGHKSLSGHIFTDMMSTFTVNCGFYHPDGLTLNQYIFLGCGKYAGLKCTGSRFKLPMIKFFLC